MSWFPNFFICFQYMIALLKILLAAAPTSKAKTDSINIMTDVLPQEMPYVKILKNNINKDLPGIWFQDDFNAVNEVGH